MGAANPRRRPQSIKADFHLVQSVARATFSFCLRSSQVQSSRKLFNFYNTTVARATFCTKWISALRPGSHEQHNIRTRSIRKQNIISPQGLAKTKQQEFFFVSSFFRLMAYAMTMILCLCLWLSLCRRLDFIPLFCLLFCLLFCPYAYAYAHKWTRTKLPS